jgi:hypothetical protein
VCRNIGISKLDLLIPIFYLEEILMGSLKKMTTKIVLLFLIINLILPGSTVFAVYSDPSVTLTAPKNNSVQVTNSTTVAGKVYHTDLLKVNGTTTSFNSEGNFSTTVTLKNRTNTIPVVVSSGVYSYTYSVTVYYSFTPTITITSHKSGAIADTEDVIIKGTINITDLSDIDTFTVGGEDAIVSSDGTFTAGPITLKRGDNDIKAVLKTTQIDIPGGGKIASKTLTKSVKIKFSDLPAITVDEPLEGSTVYTNIVTISGSIDKSDEITSMKIGDQTVTIDSGSFGHEYELEPGKNEIKLSVGLTGAITTKTLIVYYSTLAKSGSIVKALMEDGGEIKGFDDLVKIKFAKSSVDLNTTALLTVEDSSGARTCFQAGF